MERTVPSQILSRNDTSANWSSVNPILKKGELGIEIATDNSTYIKVGDGVTHWNDLAYIKAILTDDVTGKLTILGTENGLLYTLALN